ncbi:PREDICTED: LOW QUALITY PROTEIN: probable G-protein coupled receptor 142, partial [Merops nubicus]|uniref:LOW QUALITY PROTEIN: probable G-protein coupled receptor 142 n=1 Tax=Merops nubicus TaxID=57421 RepID=UPI0004F0077D
AGTWAHAPWGSPGTPGHCGQGGCKLWGLHDSPPPVNILTAVALSLRTKKSSYWYLLALTASDILTQVFIIFVGFILQTAILGRFLLAVTTVFIVLWAPRVMICHLYVASGKRDWCMHLALDVANVVAMLNSTLNFFLCCFVSQTFCHMVGEVLRAHLCLGTRPGSARLPPPALKLLELLAGTAL